MGYGIVIGECYVCRNMMGFNPHKVPVLVIQGVRREICEMCARRWNEMHPEKAREILAGAYEAVAEEEL